VSGQVAVVGAGPGDPGLMTVRGLTLLRRAEVVIYDRLVDPRLLEEAPVPGAGSVSSGSRAGTPFVFGRGGEGAAALAAAGVPFEVVPGASSVVAVPAYAGVPVTHRGVASSFAVVTGHEGDDKAILSLRRSPSDDGRRARWRRPAP
jgi:siroheme synthase